MPRICPKGYFGGDPTPSGVNVCSTILSSPRRWRDGYGVVIVFFPHRPYGTGAGSRAEERRSNCSNLEIRDTTRVWIQSLDGPKGSPLRSYSVRSQGLYRIYYHSLGFRKGRSRLLDPTCDELLVLGQCLCLPFFVLATGNGGKLIIVPALNG